MGIRFVKKSELSSLERLCISEIKELKELVNDYCKCAAEVDSVIQDLLIYYNTDGGVEKVKEIENIDLLDDSFKNLIVWADSINISYIPTDMYEVNK